MRTVITSSLMAAALGLGMVGQASANPCLVAGAFLVDRWDHLPDGVPPGLIGNTGVLQHAEPNAEPGDDPLFETICSDSGRGNGVEFGGPDGGDGDDSGGETDPGNSNPQNQGGDTVP